jgi:hypothetical protein
VLTKNSRASCARPCGPDRRPAAAPDGHKVKSKSEIKIKIKIWIKRKIQGDATLAALA